MYLFNRIEEAYFGLVGDDNGSASRLALNSAWRDRNIETDVFTGQFEALSFEALPSDLFQLGTAPQISKPDLGPVYNSTSNSMTYFSEVLVMNGTYGAGDTIPDGLALTSTYLTIRDFGVGGDTEIIASGDTSSIWEIGGVNLGGPPAFFDTVSGLNTNNGVKMGYVFSFAGQTYFIPTNTTGISGTNTTSGTSDIESTAVSSVEAAQFLIPHDTIQFGGTVFYEDYDSGGSLTTSGTTFMTIYDEDMESSVNNFDFEQMFLTSFGNADADTLTEGIATISHAGGLIGGVRTVRVEDESTDTFFYLFDEAQLAVKGISAADVIGVGTFTAGSHSTDAWADLGFNNFGIDVIGTSEDDIVSGSDFTDTFFASLGNDTWFGRGGFDFFLPGSGAETIDGGSGDDQVNYDSNSVGITLYMDGVTPGIGGNAQGDILSNIEAVVGTDFDDVIYSFDDARAFLGGGDGNDMLYAAHTGAALSGEDGDDSLIYTTDLMTGIGNDLIDVNGGAGVDELVIAGSVNTSRIGGQLNFATDNTMSTMESVRFDSLDSDTDLELEIVSHSFAYLQGQSWSVVGDAGNAGRESVFIDMTHPRFFEFITSIDLSGWNFTDWGSANEIFIATHKAIDTTVTGTSQRDHIVGGNGDDDLFGGDGDDMLNGGNGVDTIQGNNGDDFIEGGNGRDRLEGGDGRDVIFGGADTDFLIGGAGRDEMFGGAQSDRMFGGDGNDIMIGGGSNDIMHGGGNADIMYGGLGNDNMNGGSNVDRLYGQENNDTIYGGNAGDQIDGGSGNDLLFGGNRGTGADGFGDTFIFANNFGTDVIGDFEDGLDVIDFSGHTGINDFNDVLARASEDGTSLLIATNANNTLIIENFSLAELDASDFVF